MEVSTSVNWDITVLYVLSKIWKWSFWYIPGLTCDLNKDKGLWLSVLIFTEVWLFLTYDNFVRLNCVCLHNLKHVMLTYEVTCLLGFMKMIIHRISIEQIQIHLKNSTGLCQTVPPQIWLSHNKIVNSLKQF